MTNTIPLDGELIVPEAWSLGHYGRWLAVGLLVALLALMGWGLRVQGGSPIDSGPAPDFSLTTFEGETVTLSELRGQVVILNFWASWCPPCREEAAYLESTWRKYQNKGVVFVGIDYLDAKPNALAYIEEFDITYPNGQDIGQRIAKVYNIKGVPETFYVDKAGQVRDVHIGPLYAPTLDDKIDELLAE